MNPFMNFQADANVNIPVYNELIGVHKVKAEIVTVAYDSDNLANIPSEDLIRDWTNPNACVYFMFTNEFGVFHYRNYFYGFMKWDELKMDPMWNDKLHLFRMSTVATTKPYAIYIGDVPINVRIGNLPDGSPEIYVMHPNGRVPSIVGTAHTRKLYSITCKALGMPGCNNPELLRGCECWIEVKSTFFNGKKKTRLHQISDQRIGGNVVAPEHMKNPKLFGGALDSNDLFDVS